MCCHQNPERQSLLNALRLANPKLKISDQDFWHGHNASGNRKASETELAAAIDGAWIVTTGSDRYERLSAAEKITATQAYVQARTDALDGNLGVAAVTALQRYVDETIRSQRRNEIGRKIGGKTVMTAAATALVSIGMLVGGIVMPQGDASTLFKHPTSVSSVYSAAHKGQCTDGERLVILKKSHKVAWEWRNGNVSSKTVKAGQKICRVAAVPESVALQPVVVKGTFEPAPTNAAGEITGLPADFPKNPTAGDYEKLDMAWDSKLALGARFDFTKPKVMISKAQTATNISYGKVTSAVPVGFDGSGSPEYDITADYTVTGGSGVLEFADRPAVTLNPNGSITFSRTIRIGSSSSSIPARFNGVINDNYGQAKLPTEATSLWFRKGEYTEKLSLNNDTTKGGYMEGSFSLFYDAKTGEIINRG